MRDFHASPKRLQEVGDTARSRLRLGFGDGYAGRRSGLDQLEYALAVGVPVAGRLPRLGEKRDQLLRHLQLALRDRFGDREVVDLGLAADLVGEEERLQHQRARRGADRREIFLRTKDEPSDGDLARVLHRPNEQGVRLLGAHASLGSDEVALLEVHGVDVHEVDELLDLDGLGLLGAEGPQLVGIEEYELVAVDLVSLDEVLVGDF